MTEKGRSAFVTGGSSGIGLAAALRLARTHDRVALFARDMQRLRGAADLISQRFPGCRVTVHCVDVACSADVKQTMAEAVREVGAPDRVILSAGIVELGETEVLTEAAHRRAMEVNYFGVLWSIRSVLPHLSRGARIGIVGSMAGIAATYGYAAYAPSKFALRGLVDILRVELAGKGIGVTLCLPPDTDTPMLARERAVRHPVTVRMAAGAPTLSADDVARALLAGMDRDSALVLPCLAAKLTWWLAPVLSPILRWQQTRLLRQSGPHSAEMFPDHVDEHRDDAPDQEGNRRDQ